eukprot:TRINITY_DN16590_c0_g1_i1.p1 TRINITY_DN16590_c0_g1~~TRINITY_DN16590_c0_g1_i1.p1  ORF type:complete len:164 (-),score=14.17 TRINITY_DN16590_c0_g1_i1:331-822(-)
MTHSTLLLNALAKALGLVENEMPEPEDETEFMESVSALMGEDCLSACVRALTAHRDGTLGHEDTLMRLVILLKSRPHLLCGLSQWVPEDKLESCTSPSYLEIKAGINDTMRRSSTTSARELSQQPLCALQRTLRFRSGSTAVPVGNHSENCIRGVLSKQVQQS